MTQYGKGGLWGCEIEVGLDAPDVVQTDRFHLLEVIFNYPSLPVVFQYALCVLLILQLSEGIFIDDVIVSRVFEDTRCYPRLDPIE